MQEKPTPEARPTKTNETTLGKELSRLGTSSLIYLLPTFFFRGLNFLLAPLFTRVMTPDDYGIVGFASSLNGVLATMFGLAVPASLSRFHFDLDTEEERARFNSTIVVFLCTWPVALALVLHQVGRLGWLDVFGTVRFEPHLKYVLWSGLLAVFPSIYINIYTAREQPRRIAVFNVGLIITSVSVALIFVVGLRQGALGQLRASVVSGVLIAMVSVGVVLATSGLSFSWKYLVRAIKYSAPLMPHTLSNWALAASDRVLLERFVAADELGRYSLGYTFATATGVVSGAINLAFLPAIMRQLKAGRDGDAAKLGTYALVPTATMGMLIAVACPDAIRLLAAPAFHSSGRVVGWVVVGFVMQGTYAVWSIGTHYSKRTAFMPIVTALGAAVNIGLNILFVPRFGILAAAVTTAIGYAVMAIAHGVLAHMTYQIRWEYRRWVVLFGSALVGHFVASVEVRLSPAVALPARVLVAGSVFGAMLWAIRFLRPDEKEVLRRGIRRLRTALKARLVDFVRRRD